MEQALIPPKPVGALPPIKKYIALAKKSAELFNFQPRQFVADQIRTKKVVSAIKTAIKEGWDLKFTKNVCKTIQLNDTEAAFVLNFAHVYWPVFEIEANLREKPGSMVGYLKSEIPSNIKENGYCSLFFSLLDEKGDPAGVLNGAVIDVSSLLSKFQHAPPTENFFIAFVGYVGVDPTHRNQNADTVLLAQFKEQVDKIAGENPVIYIAQVDQPLSFKGDAERKFRAEADLRLWTSKYDMGMVPGLRSFEAIHKYGSGEATIRDPAKQPPLDLIIRPISGKGEVDFITLKSINLALFLYYEVEPKVKIKGTDTIALDEYVRFALDRVQPREGIIKLVKPSVS